MEIQWALIIFTAVSGAGAWLFACATIQHLWKKTSLPTELEAIVSFVAIALGGCISVLHLKHVDRIMEALNHPTSGIFTEAALVGILCVLIAIYFIMLKRQVKVGPCKVMAIIISVVGIVFSYACGASYMMESRPALATIATPLSYLGTAALAGAVLNMLLKALKGRSEDAKVAGYIAIGAGVLGVVLSLAFIAVAASAGAVFDEASIVWIVLLCVTLAVSVFAAFKVFKGGSADGASAGETADAAVLTAGDEGSTPVAAAGAPVAAGVKSPTAVCACGVVAALIAALAIRAIMWLLGTPVMDFFMMSLE